jgi:uncharacterized membrane protein
MESQEKRDVASTIAGGGAGIGLLMTVRWDSIPHGEEVKVAVAVVLMVAGYFAYRARGSKKNSSRQKDPSSPKL